MLLTDMTTSRPFDGITLALESVYLCIPEVVCDWCSCDIEEHAWSTPTGLFCSAQCAAYHYRHASELETEVITHGDD